MINKRVLWSLHRMLQQYLDVRVHGRQGANLRPGLWIRAKIPERVQSAEHCASLQETSPRPPQNFQQHWKQLQCSSAKNLQNSRHVSVPQRASWGSKICTERPKQKCHFHCKGCGEKWTQFESAWAGLGQTHCRGHSTGTVANQLLNRIWKVWADCANENTEVFFFW